MNKQMTPDELAKAFNISPELAIVLLAQLQAAYGQGVVDGMEISNNIHGAVLPRGLGTEALNSLLSQDELPKPFEDFIKNNPKFNPD